MESQRLTSAAIRDYLMCEPSGGCPAANDYREQTLLAVLLQQDNASVQWSGTPFAVAGCQTDERQN